MDHVRQLCERLKDFGMAISPEKCVLGVDGLKFLGHIVDKHGIIPTPKEVQGITDFKELTDQKGVLRYLGMLNYSLPKIAAILQPLYATATKKLERGQKFVWTSELQTAFDNSKQRLREHTQLVHPDPEAPLAIVTDASLEGIGGALE